MISKFFTIPLIDRFRRAVGKADKIIVFANHGYLEVLENWLAAMHRIGVESYEVICLDEPLYRELQRRKIPSLLRPCAPELGELWVHRIEVISEFLESGCSVIHSDADAVWLKDPRGYLERLPHDMLFSQGTFWPQDVHAGWGFVLCCGFFMIRSTPDTRRFAQELLQRVRVDRDDQVSCNRMLAEAGTVWEAPEGAYVLSYRQNAFVCSPGVRSGRSPYGTVALLPHRYFQRMFEEEAGVFVRHLLSEKESGNILDVLERYGCRFT